MWAADLKNIMKRAESRCVTKFTSFVDKAGDVGAVGIHTRHGRLMCKFLDKLMDEDEDFEDATQVKCMLHTSEKLLSGSFVPSQTTKVNTFSPPQQWEGTSSGMYPQKKLYLPNLGR